MLCMFHRVSWHLLKNDDIFRVIHCFRFLFSVVDKTSTLFVIKLKWNTHISHYQKCSKRKIVDRGELQSLIVSTFYVGWMLCFVWRESKRYSKNRSNNIQLWLNPILPDIDNLYIHIPVHALFHMHIYYHCYIIQRTRLHKMVKLVSDLFCLYDQIKL